VHDLGWSVLAELPVGETDRLGHAHAFTYPPSLAQAVDALAGWPGVTAFVEIKRSSLRRFGRETVLRRVSEILRPVLDRCVLISFDLPTVKILRLMTGARIGWVLSQYDADAQAQAAELAPQYLFCNLERLPAAPEPLWAGPWDWALYEVRDLKTARACCTRTRKAATSGDGRRRRRPGTRPGQPRQPGGPVRRQRPATRRGAGAGCDPARGTGPRRAGPGRAGSLAADRRRGPHR
jgi:hypothetical protein